MKTYARELNQLLGSKNDNDIMKYQVRKTERGFELFLDGVPTGDDPFETAQDAVDAAEWFCWCETVACEVEIC